MDTKEPQKQYKYLREKASRLRKALAIETDVLNKFKLEQQVAEAEKELSEFEKNIEFIDTNKVILKLKGKSNEIHCVFSNKATIGRALVCDFRLKDDAVLTSNLHAAVSYNSSKNEYWIEDLKSVNGTYINGERIEKPTLLSWGDKIGLGSSTTLTFEHNQNNSLCAGVFIEYNFDREEITRYLLAPKGKLLVGSNPNEVVRFPVFRDNFSLGSIEKKVDGFYFFEVNNHEKLLEDNTELGIDFFKLGISIPSIAPKEPFNRTEVLTDDLEKTKDDLEEIERPSEEAKPPYLWKLNIFWGFSVLLVGFVNFTFFKPDISQIGSIWVDECLKLFDSEDKELWRESHWPPKAPVNVVFLKSPKSLDNFIEQHFIEKSGVVEKDIPIYLSFKDFSKRLISEQSIQRQDPTGSWLSVAKINERGFLWLQVTYWPPQSLTRAGPLFQWERTEFLYWHLIISLLIAGFSSGLIRYLVLETYRQKLNKQYEEFQKKRTEKIFEAKSQLNDARSLAQRGELAQALILVNRLLKSGSRSMPVQHETFELKKLILLQIESGGGAITVSSLNKSKSSYYPSSSNTINLLYLRILGTPYAYQAPYGLEEISIGRQRRKQGASVDDRGNDIVIRVPGSDRRSLQISRRHLEIKRIDTEYFAIDKSGGHTKLNGKPLVENQPYRLQSNDRLSIADVLSLEVLIRLKLTGTKANNLIKIDSLDEDRDKLLVEASIGDMLTEVSYEEC
jgi:pSer/pThr/pTyr-binding forkhead associated (FHA) protein